MGFLDGLGRFLQGKAVFEDEGAPHSDAPQVPSPGEQPKPAQSPLVDEHGYKIIPHVTLDHVEVYRDRDTMTVTAWVANHSDKFIRLEHIHVLGQKQVLNRELGPNDSHKETVYKGAVALNEYDSHAEMPFYIKDNQDRFENVYHVEFHRESDGKFTIEEFHEDGPVRDI